MKLLFALLIAVAANAAGPGDTEVLKWKDGKKAVFMLEFDDSCESHVKIAIPEMVKRGLVGTFYINPGNGPYKNRHAAWEKEIPAMGMEYGNHTFTHVGALSVEEWDKEVAQSNEVINKCFPDRKQPRLISYGTPGVKKENWRIGKEEIQKALKKYNLIERPPFWGASIHVPATTEAMSKHVDQTIAKGEMGHLDFHGVGGDWLVTPKEPFIGLLDKLVACRDQLWITDPISWHKYQAERKGSKIELVSSDKAQIRLRLTSDVAPAFYDYPLTLSTKLPEGWTACVVKQGKSETTVASAGGVVRYGAVPGPDEIIIKPVR